MTDTASFSTSANARVWRWVSIVLTVLGTAVVLSQVFLWNPFGPTMLTNQFLYFALACFLPQVFIYFRIHKSSPAKAAAAATDDPGTDADSARLPESGESHEHGPDPVTEARTFNVPWYYALLAAIDTALPRPAVTVDVVIPYDRGELVALLHEKADVESVEYLPEGTAVVGKAYPSVASVVAPFARVAP